MPLSDFFSISLTDLPGLAGAGYLLYSWYRDRSRELVVLVFREKDSVIESSNGDPNGEPITTHRIRFESHGVSVSPADFLSRIEIRPPLYEDADLWIGSAVAGEYPLPLLESEISRKLHIDNIDKILVLEPFMLEPGESFEVLLTTPRGTRLSRDIRIDMRMRHGIPLRRA